MILTRPFVELFRQVRRVLRQATRRLRYRRIGWV
jgi:hypothetical protein